MLDAIDQHLEETAPLVEKPVPINEEAAVIPVEAELVAEEVRIGAEEAASVAVCSAEANQEDLQGLARFNRRQNVEFADQLETFIAHRGTG